MVWRLAVYISHDLKLLIISQIVQLWKILIVNRTVYDTKQAIAIGIVNLWGKQPIKQYISVLYFGDNAVKELNVIFIRLYYICYKS